MSTVAPSPAEVPETADQRRRALLTMLEDLQEEREQVRAARRRWLATVDALRDPLLVHDAQFRVVRCNRAYAERAGRSLADIIGKPYWECFPRREGPLPACGEHVRGDASGAMPSEDFAPASNEIFTSEAHGIPEPETGGHLWLHVFRNVTSDRMLDARMRDLNGELEARVAARTVDLEKVAADLRTSVQDLEAFSYSVSHDLRAPLRAIDGFSAILAEDYGPRLDDEGRRLIRTVRDSVSGMRKLIDAILSFSRASRQRLALEPVDLAALAREVFEEQRAAEADRRVELRVSALPRAHADPRAIRQVLANLIGNAIKFTRGREPAVVEISGRGVPGGEEFAVADNGAGFDPAQADKLFGMFQRLHAASEFEGAGVGLTIVRRIVEKHGGRVWAEGAAGRGATFHFFLPHSHGQ